MDDKIKNDNELTYCVVDLKAVHHNLTQLARLASRHQFFLPTRPKISRAVKPIELIMPVIKADAYGHGMREIALLLDKAGVGFYGVSNVTEGAALRRIGIQKPILLFESTLPSQAEQIIEHRLTPTVCTLELAGALARRARQKNTQVDIHVKVDTGMGRLGVWHEEAFAFIRKIHKFSQLRIMGIFTHFPAADTDKSFTRKQLGYLYGLVTSLDKIGLVIPYIHASNSMGLAGYPTQIVNLARPGLMLYGLYPHPGLRSKIRLKPVLKVQSRVIFLKNIKKGLSISYGRTYFTKRDMRVATIPIGYNDGYFRAFSNKAAVLIDGVRCPVVGRVTMDQTMVDASRVKRVKIGSSVTVLGSQKKQTVSAEELADCAGTINYEIVCGLGNRLPRRYV